MSTPEEKRISAELGSMPLPFAEFSPFAMHTSILYCLLIFVLAVVMVIGIFAVSVSAAPAAPEFKLKIKSQSSSSVVFVLSLASGSVNSFDIKFNVSGPIGACKSIAITSELRDLKYSIEDSNGIVSMANNTDTKMISFASTKTISKAIPLYEITFAKSSKNVTTSDYGATFSSCVLLWQPILRCGSSCARC